MFSGYTKSISREEFIANGFNSCVEILQSDPGNYYWQTALLSSYKEAVEAGLIVEPECTCTTYDDVMGNPCQFCVDGMDKVVEF